VKRKSREVKRKRKREKSRKATLKPGMWRAEATNSGEWILIPANWTHLPRHCLRYQVKFPFFRQDFSKTSMSPRSGRSERTRCWINEFRFTCSANSKRDLARNCYVELNAKNHRFSMQTHVKENGSMLHISRPTACCPPYIRTVSLKTNSVKCINIAIFIYFQ
jgi:hypothetical protein